MWTERFSTLSYSRASHLWTPQNGLVVCCGNGLVVWSGGPYLMWTLKRSRGLVEHSDQKQKGMQFCCYLDPLAF